MNNLIFLSILSPALEYAQDLNINTALGKCLIYDTIIDHKNGLDPDSIKAIIKRTQRKEGPRILVPDNEGQWLKTFLAVRLAVLTQPFNHLYRNGWMGSSDRIEIFYKLIRQQNWDLVGPINIDTIHFKANIS